MGFQIFDCAVAKRGIMASKLVDGLRRQNEELRRDLLQAMEYAERSGVFYPRCLNCGMPTERGVGACGLCPLDDNGERV
jgi:hypothetical protein